MGTHMASRRRLIRRHGRPMVLSRDTAVGVSVAVSVTGTDLNYRPEQTTGDIRQGDRKVSLLNDEILAAGWPGPPRPRDRITIDGLTCAVEGSYAIYEGTICIGHDLQVRGGR